MGAIFSSFYQTVASASVPEVLGASSIQFNTAVFIGMKAKDTPNSAAVSVRSSNGSVVVMPRVGETWSAPSATYATAADFTIDVIVAGDGLLCMYALADFKSFSDLESTLEHALSRYVLTVGATLDDCSFTTGISADERTADNINCYVETASERIINSGVFDANVTLQVRSQCGKAGDSNRLLRHRLRTAYVRDLILDPDAEMILSSLDHRLCVYDDSIREVTINNNIEDRTWVSDISFTCTASTSGIK